MVKKVLLSIAFIAFVAISSIYIYLFTVEPLKVGFGYVPKTSEVIIDLNNQTMLPIFVNNILVENENGVHIEGDKYKYRVKGKHLGLSREQLEDESMKDNVQYFKPFSTFYLKANDDQISNSVLIENGSFKEINKLTVKFRVLGIFPFQVHEQINTNIEELNVKKKQTKEMSWGLKRLNKEYPELTKFTGKGVNIALIDSGVSEHAAFSIKDSISLIDDRPDEDSVGHGTLMAGNIIGKSETFRGVAPGANLYSIKVVNQESAKIESLKSAIEWSIENDMDIMNISISSDEEMEMLEDSIKKAYDKGIYMIASVGDWDSKTIGYPSKFEEVMAVAAVDIDGELHGTSNYDEQIDVIQAPGVAMLTTNTKNDYGYISGSSIATSFVSGTLALLLEKNENATKNEIQASLSQITSKIAK